jgi:hypothetical protein
VPQGPALGLTEDNALLLESPASARPDAFTAARAELAALRPAYVRLLIDWAALAPAPGRAPQLSGTVDGCARRVGPCGAYAGVRGELEAIASQQRASQAAGGRRPFQVVIDILGVPAWASSASSGCQLPGARGAALALTPQAVAGYRSLIDALLALARSQGVALRWWSPWNEPNDGRFLAPQRARCEAGSPPLAPAAYGELARAMAAELRRQHAGAGLLLGELGGITGDSPHATSIGSFVAALPEEVVCLASAWSVHAYASYGPGASGAEPVAALQDALDARGGCGARTPLWVTEAGAGAPRPGAARAASAGQELEGCRALAAQLARWSGDARVGAVFQYSFREDPAFPVGLVSADLRHLYPTYGLWLAYARRRAAGQNPAPAPGACGP